MRRPAITWLALLALACTQQDPRQDPRQDPQRGQTKTDQTEPDEPDPQWQPIREPKPEPEVVRKDLVAEDLPPVPTLATIELTTASEGALAFPDGTDELAPRAAVALGGGLLIAGQAYLQRRPGKPSQSWRWLGFVPADRSPSSIKLEPGAIRAAVAGPDGGALLTGTSGIGFDARGWFGVVDGDAKLGVEVDLDSPNTTEMFDVIVGASEGELAIVAGYVDAQGWLVSLDAHGQQRWQKFIGSYGYTQVRGLARLDGARADLLALGSRAKTFGESWWAKSPGDGGDDAGGDDVEQGKLEIEGADPHQMLRVIVDVGAAGYVALGTAKKNHLQAHDQLLAVAFDRSGARIWSQAIPEVRVTDVFGGGARRGAAMFVVGIPADDPDAPDALALVEFTTPADGSASVARKLDDSEGWASAGIVDQGEADTLVSYVRAPAGIKWRQLRLAK